MSPSRSAGRARRVLVVAPNWLGDVVMTTPLLTWLDAVRRAPDGPRFEVVLAVRAAWAPLFTGDTRVDGLLVTARPGLHDGVAGAWRQAGQWRQGAFNAALLGPPSLRAAAVAALAGIPCRVGHGGDGRDPLLTRRLARACRGERHFSREMLDLGRELAQAEGWPPAALASAATAPDRLLAGPAAAPAPGARPLWALGAGTSYGPAKNWPAGCAADFLRGAVDGSGARVLLLGDAAAAPQVAELRAATLGLSWARGLAAIAGETEADVIDLTGATDLPTLLAWLRACAVYVGSDSGLMHVAAALGTPTVGLFGSSSPGWTSPLGSRVATMGVSGFACSPCFRRTCNQSAFCLESLTGAAVLGVVRGLLAAGGGGAVPEVPR